MRWLGLNGILVGMLLMTGVQAAAAETQTPTPVQACLAALKGGGDLKAVPGTHVLPTYPPLSQALNEQGTTIVLVTIGPDGVPTDASVSKSSGSQRLDAAAIDSVKQSWRWQPLPPACPVGARTLVSITWNLLGSDSSVVGPTIEAEEADYPPQATAHHEEGSVVLTVILNAGGLIDSIVVDTSSGFPDLDIKAQEIARRHSFQAARIDGQTVPSGVVVIIKFVAPAH